MRHREAQDIAGLLFGRILARNADKDGYAYALDCLCKGVSPLKLCAEMMSSDEFVQNFLLDCKPSEIVDKMTRLVCGWEASEAERKAGASTILRHGLSAFADDILQKRARYFGPLDIPDVGRGFIARQQA